MDLSNLDIPEVVELPINLPDGSPLMGEDGVQAVIGVRGPHHPTAQAYKKLVSAKLRKAMSKKGGSGNIYDAIDDGMETDRLHAHTDYVRGIELDGEPLTRDTMRRVYGDPKFSWLNEQVTEKLGSWDSFLG